MKVIVNDKDFQRSVAKRRFVENENANNDVEEVAMGRVGGKYDFIMMVGDGTVYGFQGEEIYFAPIGDLREPLGFQWKVVKDKDIDVKWRPLDDECEYGDEVEYDDGEEDWIPFEDFIGKCY